MSKVFILGIDGGSLKLIEQWQDELPNFREIMKNGVYGELESTIPPITCPAWPCMFTGKNPAELGIYDFVGLSLEGGYKSTLHNSLDYFPYSLWRILSDSGKKVGLFNVPITYPPPRVNGFSVSGLLTPFPGTTRAQYTYPPSLRRALEKAVSGYEIEAVVDLTMGGKEKQHIATFDEMLSKKLKAAKYLVANFDWDLFICVFTVLDRIQHYFWHHMDETHPRHTTDQYQTVVKDFYKKVDQAMGELFSMLPAETNILIDSDHGFQALHGRFLVNKWLEKNGLLYFNKSPSLEKKSLQALKSLFLSISNPTLIRLVSKLIPQKILTRLLAHTGPRGETDDILSSIDWSRTKAFTIGTSNRGGTIFVNLKGRNPSGIVQPGDEYELVRQDIIDRLKRLLDPNTGEPAGIQVFKKEEVYHGKYLASAPDILFLKDNYLFVGARVDGDSEWRGPQHCGTHALQGVFMAYGPDIKKSGEKLPNLKIYDITPTILHMFGLPIAKDMDGRVLTEIFDEGSETGQRQITYREVDYEAERIKDKVSRLKRSRKL